MTGLREDLRYAIRAIARHRGLALAAVLSLALGIGANTTIFSMLHAILLRPLPVEDPSRLVTLHTTDPRIPGLLLCSYPNYKDYRDRNSAFSSLLIYSAVTVTLTGHGDPQLLMGQLVSGNYFPTLGVRPVIGRGFLPEEDAALGAHAVAVISHPLWLRLYGGDPQVTAKSISLNGRSYRIIGVAPPDFRGLDALYAADVWAPISMYENLYPNVAWVNQRRALLFAVAGRLKPGVTAPEAEAAMQVLSQDLEREYPRDNAGRRIRLSEAAVDTMAAEKRATVSRAGLVLMVVSGLVLLIACANVANLLLARAANRGKEIAVRLALGASRWQLMRQFLFESTLLGILGGATGLLLAKWARDVLWALRPPLFKHAGFSLQLDTAVLIYTLVVAFLTGILFGLAPALRATRANLATDLKERTGQGCASPGRVRLRALLVASQVALSVIALVGAGLFLRSVWSASGINMGFDPSQVGLVAFNLAGQGYDEARGRQYQEQVMELASATPGVTSTTLSKDGPMQVSAARTVLLDGQEGGASNLGRAILTSVVSPNYFRTMRLPLLRGRDFGPTDTKTTPRVAIVNEAAAAHFWPGQEAIGKVLHFYGDPIPAQVVGVAHNANYLAIGEEPRALIYLSLVQYYFPTAVIYFRTEGDPAAVAAQVRRRMQPLDRNLLLQAEPFSLTLRQSMWAQRISAGLLAVFGALALMLASVGIYGVISYSVTQRVREFGVRMALGATAWEIRRMVLREGGSLVVAGLGVGILAALPVARSVQSLLFVVSAWDFTTFLAVPAVLAIVGLAACWIPASRVSTIDPATALRDE